MEVRLPPYPEYREQEGVVAARDYRVVFWQQQLPPEGSAIPADQMGWAELTLELSGAEDVHEAIGWAESHIDECLAEGSGEAVHGERLYVLFVKVPNENRFLHIAGWDPVRNSDSPLGHNLSRRHPLP